MRKKIVCLILSMMVCGGFLLSACDVAFDAASSDKADTKLTYVEAKEPTCTEAGNIGYWTDGENFYSDEAGSVRIDETVRAAFGHDEKETFVEATCIAEGYTLYRCSRCEAERRETSTGLGEHAFCDWEIKKEPTCLEEGVLERTCAVCERKESKTLLKVGHQYRTDNVCRYCELKIEATASLLYTRTEEGYAVSGVEGEAVDIVIPVYYEETPITEIADGAFRDLYGIRSVTVYAPIVRIGQNVFRNCQALERIVLPDSLKTVGANAFYRCKKLTSVTLGRGVREIGQAAFYDCEALTTILFRGTAAEWQAVEKGKFWDRNCLFTVICSDGEAADQESP